MNHKDVEVNVHVFDIDGKIHYEAYCPICKLSRVVSDDVYTK